MLLQHTVNQGVDCFATETGVHIPRDNRDRELLSIK